MPRITVEVCAGTYCTMMGAMDIIAAIESLKDLQDIGAVRELDIRAIPCPGLCSQGQQAPVVIVNGQTVLKADMETIMSLVLAEVSRCGGQ